MKVTYPGVYIQDRPSSIRAIQGMNPNEAYFVKCDSETTTQDDIDLGVVNIIIGFAPLKPAQFVIIRIHQVSG